MSRVNSNVPTTVGAGASVATHLISGNDYQTIIFAGPDGYLQGLGDMYVITALAIPMTTPPKDFLALINQPNSNVILKVHAINSWSEQTTGIPGTPRGIRVFRCTSASDGDTIANSVIPSLNNAAGPVAPGVGASRASASGTTGLTITGGATEPLVVGAINTEEAGGGGLPSKIFRALGEPMLLSTGQGLTMRTDSTALGLASVSGTIWFEVVP